MKKYLYPFLILSISGVPASLFAQEVPALPDIPLPDVRIPDAGDIQVGNVRVRTDTQGGASVQVGDVEVNTSSSGASVRAGTVEVRTGESASVTIDGVRLDLSENAPPVFSLGELKQSIQERSQELGQELASTSERVQGILENANQIRLAVHTLLASKDLLGGIGRQVSQIARQVNDSVATTTSAEAKIQSRSFFTKLFFGGDRTSADMISGEVTKNEAKVKTLTGLLDGSGISAQIREALNAQIGALKAEQERLQMLAQKERDRWGIFSWRLF